MTKLEVIQHLQGRKDKVTEILATKLSDEQVLRDWNYRDILHNKGIGLVKVGEEFQVEFHAIIRDFTKDAMNYFLANQ